MLRKPQSQPGKNYIFHSLPLIKDEIALEGLDGITLQALFVRLNAHKAFSSKNILTNTSLQKDIWSFICTFSDIDFYILPSPRKSLRHFNRFVNSEEKLDTIYEQEQEEELYPVLPIENEGYIQGSSQTFKTRVPVYFVAHMSFDSVVEKYGNSLVIVASQPQRWKALEILGKVDVYNDPLLTRQYICLERMGRARWNGETSHGKNSLNALKDLPKTLSYVTIKLMKLDLIRKQQIRQKTLSKDRRQSGGPTQVCSLFHLNRFYEERQSKHMKMIHDIIQILIDSPNYTRQCRFFNNQIFRDEKAKQTKKLCHSAQFNKFIDIVHVPLYEFNPTEKTNRKTRCFRLKDPTCKFEDLKNYFEEEKADNIEDDEQENEFSDKLEIYKNMQKTAMQLHRTNLTFFIHELAALNGPKGITQVDTQRTTGFGRLDGRTLCRTGVSKKLLFEIMNDSGKQRVTSYISNKYSSRSDLVLNVNKELKTFYHMLNEVPPNSVENPEVQANEEPSQEANRQWHKPVEFIAEEESTDIVEDVAEEEIINVDEKEIKHIVEKRSKDVNEGELKGENEAAGISIDHTEEDIQEESEYQEDVLNSPQSSFSELNCKKFRHADRAQEYENAVHATVKEMVNFEKGVCSKLSFLDSPSSSSNYSMKSGRYITPRILKRAIIILGEVKKHKVVSDLKHLYNEIEKTESLQKGKDRRHKMCRKSIYRILGRLQKDRYVKFFNVTYKCEDTQATQLYICDPSITEDSEEFKTAIKHKKQLVYTKSLSSCCPEVVSLCERNLSDDYYYSSAGFDKNSIDISMQQLKNMNQLEKVKDAKPSILSNKIPNQGISSKFIRMRELHHMLYYLVHDYSGSVEIDQAFAWECILEEGDENYLTNQYPRLYTYEKSWKMFIPPLPKHILANDGWIFVVDVLLRLPLCLFVCIVNVSPHDELVSPYLNHPYLKYILVKDLPQNIRNALLAERKYVFYLMEVITILCYIGLVQYGNQISKEKDQVFIYLNRNATLIDTTTSVKSYVQISTDRVYTTTKYTLTNLTDVAGFWQDMETICLRTPLGCRSEMKDGVKVEYIAKRDDGIHSTSPRDINEAKELDTGYIPGDKLGAAGLDSSLYSHLNRNWHIKTNNYIAPISNHVMPKLGSRLQNTSQFPTSSVVIANLSKDSKAFSVPGCSQQYGSVPTKTPQKCQLSLYKPEKKKTKEKQSTNKSDKNEKTKGKTKKKKLQKSLKRKKVGLAKMKSKRKPYYDETDKEALRRMKKLRVDWSQREDSYLIMCRIAATYLFPKFGGVMSYCVVRDSLHSRFPESLNKTSRACNRRVNYILKNKSTERNIEICIEDVRSDEDITKEFKPSKENPVKAGVIEDHQETFLTLVDRVVEKFNNVKKRKPLVIPDSLDEFNSLYNMKTLAPKKFTYPIRELRTVSDIDYYVVYSLVFSCLCTLQDKESYGYQMYLVYQHYPSTLLNEVFEAVRQCKMTSFKKRTNRSKFPRRCLPLSYTAPFQLSLSFTYLFKNKFNQDIFLESYDMMKMLLESKEKLLSIPGPKMKKPLKRERSSSESHRSKRMKVNLNQADKTVHHTPEPMVIDNNEHQTEICFASNIISDNSNTQLCSLPTSEETLQLDQCNSTTKYEQLSSLPMYRDMLQPAPSNMLEQDEPEIEIGGKGCNIIVNEGDEFIIEGIIDEYPKTISNFSANESDFKNCSKIFGSIPSNEKGFYISTVSGGSCGTCLSLLISNKISYQITVPRQIVSITSAPEKDNLMSVFQRVKRHEDMIGKMAFMPNIPPCSKDSNPSTSSTPKPKIVENYVCAQTKAPKSRINTYLLRECLQTNVELFESGKDCIIHSCEIKVAFNLPDLSDVKSKNDIFEKILPGITSSVEKANEKAQKVCVIPPIDVSDIWPEEKMLNAEKIVEYIERFENLGANVKLIKEHFSNANKLSCDLMELICDMEDKNLIWRVGVEEPVWVSFKFTDHWVVKTNKIPRQDIRLHEHLQISNAVYDLEDNENVKGSKSVANKPTEGSSGTKRKRTASPETTERQPFSKRLAARLKNRESKESSDSEDEITSTRIVICKKNKAGNAEALRKQKLIEKARKILSYEEISVKVRPWVRLNGGINRRVVGSFLGSVITYIMENPGVPAKSIAKRFWPALIPCHTYELLDILKEIGCIQQYKEPFIELKDPFTTEYIMPDRTQVPNYDFDASYTYEATVDAHLRLGVFFGDGPRFEKDFLETCR